MKILSLFDGMACGYEALVRAGIPIDKYYASEIDKYAIQIATKNHPNIIEIGDVCEIKGEDYQDIDLLIGGSPCQGFSVAGKMLNFNDPRSKLFFEYVRLLRQIHPKYFLLENVKMKKERQDIISRELGVEPIEINSSLVSAQNRKRLYRTNIPSITQPKDKGILLKDILENKADSKYDISERQMELIERQTPSESGTAKRIGGMYGQITRRGVYDTEGQAPTITASMGMGGGHVPMIAYAPGSREYYSNGWKTDKSPTICARDYKDPKVVMIPKEGENLVSVVDGEVRIKQATKQGYIVAHEGDGISLSYPTSTTRRGRVIEGKSNTLTAGGGDCYVYDKVRIRKLTPIECERLQTLPDNYTQGVSDTQRYKMLGNGWTVDVISHIFSFIPKE